ncbi:Cytoskeleton protein RodZ [Thiorhodovibrio winogradskyi]|uniref:Cytoskeleton protein RodZ n=1 Tax=Thiorhodovibrio winogradskyi TaxID=77007 RepID=A0ABZ0SHV3_9GAMM|nr:RodZ domain-containing protein [Thiorhodovibrio winogradskyi]
MHSIDEPTPALHTDTTDPLHDSPGRQLRVARESSGLTLTQVAAEMHLSVGTIEALEDDHYDGLPSEVFIIGYLRTYARILGLNPVPLLDQYRRQRPDGRYPALPVERAQEGGGRPFQIPLMPLLGLVLLLVLGGAVWFVAAQLGGGAFVADLFSPTDEQDSAAVTLSGRVAQPVLPRLADEAEMSASLRTEGRELDEAMVDAATEEENAQADTLDAVPAPEEAPLESGAESSGETGAETGAQSGAPSRATVPSEQNPASLIVIIDRDATDPAASENDVAAENGNSDASAAAEIIMTFSGPCWVDVRDSTGEYKLFGEMNKGDRRVLGGRGPYSIILGNAAAVALTVDGKEFDVEAVARGNVARFELDPATR